MDEYEQFVYGFFQFSGIDLSRYKRPQMERRLRSLVQRVECADFHEFLNRCKRDPQLLAQLLDKMTINVSEFFRNPERWEQLAELLRRDKTKVRVWSAACATGEEPYTLAIMLKEQVGRPYELLASDIDENVLAKAKSGTYKEHQVKSVAPQFQDKYFTKQQDSYVIRDTYRQGISFAQHNLLSSAYPVDFDLIVCRNVLIYFTDEAKEHILQGFSKSLKPHGLLFVGSTEQIFSPEKYRMRLVKPFIYEKI